MPADIDLSPTTRLPFGDTIGASFRMAFSREAWSMPLIWVPFVIALVQAGLNFWNGPVDFKGLMKANGDPSTVLSNLPPTFWWSLLVGFVKMLIIYAAGLSWLRHIARGEKPSGLYLGQGFFAYIGYYIVYGLLVGLSFIPVGIVSVVLTLVAHGVGTALGIVIYIAFSVFLVWFTARIKLKFLSVAVSDPPMPWKRSYALMRGNVVTLIFGPIVAIIPFMMVDGVWYVITLYVFKDNVPVLIILSLLNVIVLLLETLTYYSFLGITYRRLVPAAAAPAVRMAPEGFA